MTASKLLFTMATAVSLFSLIDPAFSAPTKIKWTEEVQLHDGRVIRLKRTEELGSSGFPVKRRGFRKFHEFCYAPMNIYWKSKPEYRPETFEIVDGKAYAKATLGGCFECRDHNYPETNAIYFRWTGGGWKQIDHAEYPKGLRLNLLMSPSIDDDGSRDARGLVSLTEKEKRDFGMLTTMKARGVSGLNEPPYKERTCLQCKAIQSDGRPPSAEVFLPSSHKDCE